MARKRNESTLILALATGATVREAAKLSGFGESTAYRRSADPEFRNRVSAARDELWGAAIGKLANAATEAVETLQELLTCEDAKVRLGSARAILAVAPHLRETVEHERRLSELEQRHASK